ncbi:Rz1-like lysis system protein LysC [Piscinibacter terrae]|uniref:Uncharacterized protein n=1 Tax=Piscinibacter terrae TaxID=2496871 RepID=A0A3N7HIP5_9BURK|nr:hypothetical protein [Albitalea terrae]RQP21907.1 hypothetical protein DZC73_26065 [Albitalea terrae]
MRFHIVAGLLSALLSGCATTQVTVVPPAPACPVPAALAKPCTPPRTLSAGTTYGDLLLSYQADRASLELCATSFDELNRLLAACRAALSEYNASLDRKTTSP